MTKPSAVSPRVGAVANVRNRRGIITAVDEFDAAPEGALPSRHSRTDPCTSDKP
ncbi:MAG TPA: hypothetical protein VNM92_14370 [Thermoanaerobaculia bacterium]|nr:hypothetical protein [Thermoanaerobaculia bacterium]